MKFMKKYMTPRVETLECRGKESLLSLSDPAGTAVSGSPADDSLEMLSNRDVWSDGLF